MAHVDDYIRKNILGVSFTDEDEKNIRTFILAKHQDDLVIVPYLNVYWQNFPFQEDIIGVCKKFICDRPTPSLSAASMACVNDLWGLARNYADCIKYFLDIDKFTYDIWNQEIYKAYIIILENELASKNDETYLKRVANLLDDAGIQHVPRC